MTTETFAVGGCTCGQVRYRMSSAPIFVHCCHCTWCQRETGASFALNAMIETARIEVLAGAPETVLTPSESGKGQKIVRCPNCRVAVWSHYASLDTKLAFLRVGTLDTPSLSPPDVHIFVRSKQPWVVIPPRAEPYAIFYSDADRIWLFGPERMARRNALMAEPR